MTKKENLLYELIQIQNEIRTLKGESENNINLETYVKTLNFSVRATKSKAYELESEIDRAKMMLISTQNDITRKQWFETEEGKAYKESYEAQRKAYFDTAATLRKETHEMVNAFVKNLLGDEFAVTCFSSNSFVVALVEKINEDGKPEGLFGHDFTVYYGNDLLFGKFNWELNYGTLGSFKLGEDVKRTKYLMGLATFASSEKVNIELKEKLIAVDKQFNELQEKRIKLEREYEAVGMIKIN